MASRYSSTGPPVRLDKDDMDELKEVIVEFLSKYDGLYEKRIQKLIFFAEVKTAMKTGERLTDASFMPYDYGPYSKAVSQALDELSEEGRVSMKNNGQFATALDGGDLSPKKRYLIGRMHKETKRMSTEELVERAKDTWLWKEFDYAEEMDFATFIDEIVMSPKESENVDVSERKPVDDPDLSRLLSS